MSFIKSVLATVVGIMAFFAIMLCFFIGSLVGIAFSSSSPSIADNSVFVINLDGDLTERASSNPLQKIMGTQKTSLALDDMIANIKKAKANDKIKGIFLDCGSLGPSTASMEEIRRQRLDFKKSGKWIIAYADNYDADTYYLATVANKVLIHEQGGLDWHGLASNNLLLKDALAKFGIKFAVTKVGKYKSAPETLTADKMSEPNREQITAYMNGIWNNIVKGVSDSRKISAEKLNEYADSLITFSPAKDYLKYHLVDQLVSGNDEVRAVVKKMLGIGKDDDIKTVSMATMSKQEDVDTDGDEIAVYYAYGDIVDDPSTGINAASDEIVGNTVSDDLMKLADDKEVKAVVIRVNSGGGSAFASEKMWQAVKYLKGKKPVVVSMGDLAASGGYYMSCLANWIVAEKTTLTGSIGIFGMFRDLSDLLTNKLGVKYETLKTNEHSDFGNMFRSFNESEKALLEKYITRGYDLFLSRVAEGRKMTKDQVNEIAQGRVWLGEDALKNKLVDEIGGIDAALAKAAKLARMEKYHTQASPSAEDFNLNALLDQQEQDILNEKLTGVFGEYYSTFKFIQTIDKQNHIQARIPFIMEINL